MNLAIDIGNTKSKYAFFAENRMVESGIVGDLAEFNIILSERADDYDKAIVCSVSHDEEKIAALFPAGKEPHYLSHRTPVPLSTSYGTPETLGMDRLAAAIGGSALFPDQAVMVIDIGTCITYDYVSAAGVFEGGVISPGVELRYKAMHDYTARLPLLDDREDEGLIGTSTRASMKSGVINGISGEIEYMVSQFLLKSPDLKVIITGGGAKTFESRIKADIFVALEIVLVGLNRVLDYNA